ncbi:hypothetical protein L210DRAFT_3504228 [Boletus edulis BED1]|uniref:Uncharacterized protein n=1 Tax=Boletus edulis BED1 TaxID=1328754 RepID=A0AAD4BU58_BOLED|nr:hypothetical protein L210DRAFT_3504228 [Boletus edulis BED1]
MREGERNNGDGEDHVNPLRRRGKLNRSLDLVQYGLRKLKREKWLRVAFRPPRSRRWSRLQHVPSPTVRARTEPYRKERRDRRWNSKYWLGRGGGEQELGKPPGFDLSVGPRNAKNESCQKQPLAPRKCGEQTKNMRARGDLAPNGRAPVLSSFPLR